MESSQDLHTYFSRVTPEIPKLFNMAYAICGNYDLAEYALQYALMEGWFGEAHGGMGFREGLRAVVRQVAFEEAVQPRPDAPEFTWDGLTTPGGDPLLERLAQEDAQTRRIVALRYGCGLTVSRTARLTGLTSSKVRDILARFSRSASRRLPASRRRRFESDLARAVGKQFEATDEGMPSLGAIYRSFESEAVENHRPSHLASRILKRIILCALAVLCALVFWLAAVLIQPPALEEPPTSPQTGASLESRIA